MNVKIILLRICYWVGAILDLLVGLSMLFAEILLKTYGIESIEISPLLRIALWFGGALMLGWTALLVWADQKPMERKGVILMTVFPVIVGFVLTEIYGVAMGVFVIEKMGFTFIMQGFLLVLFLLSYFLASRQIPKRPRSNPSEIENETRRN